MSKVFFVAVTVLGAVLVMAATACAGQVTPTPSPATPTLVPSAPTPVSAESIARGGRLYDKWWKEVPGAAEPKGNQPLWATQTTNTRTGGDTWRCKECHGWDYKGKDGAYGKGSHATGFPGVLAGSTKPVENLTASLKRVGTPNHDFSALGDKAMADLVNFVRAGLIDESKSIDYATKKPIGGNAANGKAKFDGMCAACHGADGKTLNFGSDKEPEYVGTLAKDNPWEFLHKVRSGQPGTPMPAAIVSGWTVQDVVDVLTYAQTLPEK